MSVAVEAMISAAIATIGVGETNGDNVNYITSWYGEDGQPWCDMAVTYWAYHSGNSAPVCFGYKHDYTVEHAQAFANRGQWHTDVAGIQRGDIVFFDWSGSNNISGIDHVGVVEYVDSDGTVHTIEGNIDNVCKRELRHSNYIVGYGRPAYPADPTPTPTGNVYVVQSGDTMASISRKLGVDLADLIAANPQVPDPDVINVGQVLNVPTVTIDPSELPYVSLFNLDYAVQHLTAHASDVLLYQKALAKVVGLDYSTEVGIYGLKTVDACAKFQRLQGWSGSDADGYPGPTTLSRLASKSGLFQAAP